LNFLTGFSSCLSFFYPGLMRLITRCLKIVELLVLASYSIITEFGLAFLSTSSNVRIFTFISFLPSACISTCQQCRWTTFSLIEIDCFFWSHSYLWNYFFCLLNQINYYLKCFFIYFCLKCYYDSVKYCYFTHLRSKFLIAFFISSCSDRLTSNFSDYFSFIDEVWDSYGKAFLISYRSMR